MANVTLGSIQRAVIACTRCPELRAYCREIAQEKKRAYLHEKYWGKPVPSFGDPNARVMLVGLAPGAHGSNRTGRMFTGDASGDFLYPALFRAGFASQPNAVDRKDGMQLHDCLITAAQHCAPPQNKPAPKELQNCFPYLVEEFDVLPKLRVVLGLGKIGFDAAARMLRDRGFTFTSKPEFAHAAEFVATANGRTVVLMATFHPSRQNTNTGVLTVPMFDAIFTRVKEFLQ